MKYLSFHQGQSSYLMENKAAQVYVTVQGGCVLPYFQLDSDHAICPYWTAPWWNDRLYDDGSTISSVLRGNFFCATREGELMPEHGWCANSPWEFEKIENEETYSTLELKSYSPNDDSYIIKTIRADNDKPVIYEKNEMTGFKGSFGYYNHPCLKVPDECFSGHLKLSGIEYCTSAKDIFNPAEGSYRLLPSDMKIENMNEVHTIYGKKTDLTRHPQLKGTVELVLVESNSDEEIGYALFANPKEKYIYYQLKNSRQLPYTMLWMFNGGRHFEPWNGTQKGCLGVEELSGFPAIFSPQKAADQCKPGGIPLNAETVSVKQIYGAIKMPDEFEGITEVSIQNNNLTIGINNHDTISIELDLRFLEQ